MDAQTAGPIVPKFGMGIQEHIESAIGYVLCTWVLANIILITFLWFHFWSTAQ